MRFWPFVCEAANEDDERVRADVKDRERSRREVLLPNF